MRSDLLHGLLQRHPPVLEIEGRHVLVVEEPPPCFGRRIEGRDNVARVEPLQVLDDPIRRFEAMLYGRPVPRQSSNHQRRVRWQQFIAEICDGDVLYLLNGLADLVQDMLSGHTYTWISC